MMLINLDDPINGKKKKKKINSIPLYLVKDISDLEIEAKKMMGKILITHQTGPEGKQVKRLYIEEASDISKEFYLSCLVDRESSKITFISSTEGGMDIEKVAIENPENIITTKVEIKDEGPSKREIDDIISIFKLNEDQKIVASKQTKLFDFVIINGLISIKLASFLVMIS